MASTCSPFCLPAPSKKNAPVVSPPQPATSGPMMPAIEIPELKVYWLLVPLGHTDPGMVDDPVESTQIWPLDRMPQVTWLTLSEPPARAKSRNPGFFTVGSGLIAAGDVDGTAARPRIVKHTQAIVRRPKNEFIASSLKRRRFPTGRAP